VIEKDRKKILRNAIKTFGTELRMEEVENRKIERLRERIQRARGVT